jgi:hypothetical protein
MRERFGLNHFAVFDSAVSNREVLPGIGVIGKIPDCDTVLLLVRELVDGKAPSRKLDPDGRFIKSSITPSPSKKQLSISQLSSFLFPQPE